MNGPSVTFDENVTFEEGFKVNQIENSHTFLLFCFLHVCNM